MPPFNSIELEQLQYLDNTISPSVVTILRYNNATNEEVEYGVGFVIHVYNKKAVVIANIALVEEDEEYIFVRYANGSTARASAFVSNIESIFTSLLVDDDNQCSTPIVINPAELERGQFVVTIAQALQSGLEQTGTYPGSVIQPRCRSITRLSKTPVNDNDNLFAFSCPVSGPVRQRPNTFTRLIGAPVFNLKGEMVGVVQRCSVKSYDMKFGRLSSSFLREMDVLFEDHDWRKKIQHLLEEENTTPTDN